MLNLSKLFDISVPVFKLNDSMNSKAELDKLLNSPMNVMNHVYIICGDSGSGRTLVSKAISNMIMIRANIVYSQKFNEKSLKDEHHELTEYFVRDGYNCVVYDNPLFNDKTFDENIVLQFMKEMERQAYHKPVYIHTFNDGMYIRVAVIYGSKELEKYIVNGSLSDKEEIKTVGPSVLYENEFLRIDLINPNYPFLTMKKRGAILVPYDKNGNIYLIEKDRPNIGKYFELPRGFVENGETLEMGALRELLEETGMIPSNTELLGYVQPDSGIVNNPVPVYQVLVEEKKDFVHHDDADAESCKILRRSLVDIDSYIDNGQIICGYTQSALLKKICKDNLFKCNNNKTMEMENTSIFTDKVCIDRVGVLNL